MLFREGEKVIHFGAKDIQPNSPHIIVAVGPFEAGDKISPEGHPEILIKDPVDYIIKLEGTDKYAGTYEHDLRKADLN